MVRIDLVRKFFGGIDVKFRFENDLVVWCKVCNEVVRFDLNVVLKGDCEIFLFWVLVLFLLKMLKFNCLIVILGDESG